MSKKTLIDLVWPTAGVDRSVAYERQPPFTAPDALNVRTDDMSEFRARGGSRPGLGLALQTQLPDEIRLLTKVSVLKATWPKRYDPFGGTQLRDSLISVGWAPYPDYLVPSSYQGRNSALRGTNWGVGIPVVDNRDSGAPYEISTHVRPAEDAYSGTVTLFLDLPSQGADPAVDSVSVNLVLVNGEYYAEVFRTTASVPGSVGTSAVYNARPNTPGVFTVRVVPTTGLLTVFWQGHQFFSYTVGAISSTFNSLKVSDPSIEAKKLTAEWTVNTDASIVYDDLRRDILVAVSGGDIWMEDTADTLRKITTDLDLNDNVDLVAVDREQKLYIADYGTTVSGTTATIDSPYSSLVDTSKNFTTLGVTTNFVLQFINSNYVQNEKQEITVNDATGGNLRLQYRGQVTANIPYDPMLTGNAAIKSALEALSTINTVNVTGPAGGPWVVEFTGTHAGKDIDPLGYDAASLTHATLTPSVVINTIQNGAGGDAFLGQYQITNVSGNTISFTPPLPVADGFSAQIGAVEYQIVRAAKVFDPRQETLTIHSASTGFTPAGSRMVALYRDRIVYAGSDLTPHVWYMSRQGNPNDWDYSQEDSAAAVAAQSSVAGQLADPITALIAHGDECLIFGTYNSLWILRGDPGFGGTIDQLSRKIGIIGPHAWTRTPDDMCVFMSPDGLYVMPAGCAGMPTSLSRERLPDDLISLHASRESVHLQYDLLHRGIHIFVTKRDSSESAHWWFDWEAKAFWRVKLQTPHEPFATHERVAWADSPVVLLAGRDGYIRYFDRDFQIDDGNNPIESYCDIGPFHLDRQGFNEGILTELIGSLGQGSSSVNWEIRAGDTGHAAYEASARESGTWSREGLNYTSRPRVRGVSAIVRVKNNNNRRWFLERVTAVIRSAGRRRVR